MNTVFSKWAQYKVESILADGSEGKAQDGNKSSKGGSSVKGDDGKCEKGPVLNKI